MDKTRKSRARIIKRLLQLLLLALLIFLVAYPLPMEPVAWQPPQAPTLENGPYAENTRLKDLHRIGAPNLSGPEALVFDGEQHLVTGLLDGRVVRTGILDGSVQDIGHTGGRPLGLDWHPDGRLIIADGKLGLLAMARDGTVETLTTQGNDLPMKFTDDVAVDRTGRHAYFSDASSRWGYGQDGEAVLEHGGDGRLLRYDFKSKTTQVLLEGLQFANGVTLGPDDAYVLVAETGAYRIVRYWLTGKRAGSSDVLIDNLPGLPDNIRFNGRDRVWVALFTPRNPLVDGLAGWPWLRKVLARAMLIFPKPIDHHAMALGIDLDGRVVANLQDGSGGNYSPVTTIAERGEWLYVGSLKQTQLARLPLSKAALATPSP